jgi:hypothetical protein
MNVHDKISKLKQKIRAWSHRNLTMEGKSLIVKTFGLSQLIYNMQSYKFEKEEVSKIEKIIFKFLWSKSHTQNGVDRIKRSIMKNDHTNGGMSISDIECLNRSLKLRQFIRARNSKHAISYIQTMITGAVNILFEYTSINSLEAICEIAQETINIITDYQRSIYGKMTKEEYENDTITIDEISAIN